MHPLKAPGLDGFQALFIQQYYELTGNQLMLMVMGVLKGKELPNNLNETSFYSHPKVNNPHMITQLRSIGLCNVAYKVISTCLGNKLKLVLSNLISSTQTNFVRGRQITNNTIIVQELLHSM